MKDFRTDAKPIVIILCFVFAAMCTPCFTQAEEIRLDGTYVLAGNGDVTLSLKLTPPMAVYQQLRDSVSNLYLVLRQFASSRADTEVVDKKAEWDDSNRSMTFSMKMLGASRNLGNHWELDIPKGTEFINLDEAKRIFYFNEIVQDGDAVTVRGTSRLMMPADARNLKWEGSRRVVSYTMPPVKAPSERSLMLLVSAVALVVLGIALTAGSFFVKSPSRPGAV
jgi:hypothetical protein